MLCLTNASFPIAPTELERLRILSLLANAQKEKKLLLVIVPATALIQKTSAFTEFTAAFHTVKEGEHCDPLVLMKRWQSLGYEVQSTVEIPGTMRDAAASSIFFRRPVRCRSDWSFSGIPLKASGYTTRQISAR